jgi:putative endonuclease
MTSREIGDIGENAVAAFLEHNGYEILERNFTVRGGEIDIIARKDGRLAFVEVKTRKSGSLTSGESAITLSKRRFLLKTADAYYRGYKKKYGGAICRFDVAIAEIDNGKIKHVKYYVAAFDASGA